MLRESPCRNKNRKEWGLRRVLQGHGIKAIHCKVLSLRTLCVRKMRWRRDRLPTPVFLGFSGGSDSKESICLQCGRSSNPWIGKIPWRRAWQPNSSILAWRITWTEEPGGLQSVGLQRVGHDWATKRTHIQAAFTVLVQWEEDIRNGQSPLRNQSHRMMPELLIYLPRWATSGGEDGLREWERL